VYEGFFKDVGWNGFLKVFWYILLPKGKEFCDKINMDQGIVCEDDERADLAVLSRIFSLRKLDKSGLKRALLDKMGDYAQTPGFYLGTDVSCVNRRRPVPFKPGVFEKAKFLEIVDGSLDYIYDSFSEGRVVSLGNMAAQLLIEYYDKGYDLSN